MPSTGPEGITNHKLLPLGKLRVDVWPKSLSTWELQHKYFEKTGIYPTNQVIEVATVESSRDPKEQVIVLPASSGY